jgi:hypothetical protein
MFRTLARTLAILALAALVAGVVYVAVAAGGSDSTDGRFARRGGDRLEDESFDRGPGPWEGRRPERGERHGREDASFGRGLAGAAGTALQIGLIGAAVVFAQKRLGRRKPPAS